MTCQQGEIIGQSPSEEVVVSEPARGGREQGGRIGQGSPHQTGPERSNSCLHSCLRDRPDYKQPSRGEEVVRSGGEEEQVRAPGDSGQVQSQVTKAGC